MKKLACKDMGIKTCSFVATGESDEETKQKLIEHGVKVHADLMKNAKPEDIKKMNDLMEKILARQKS